MREVRVIADDGSQLGILPTDEALRRAEEKGLDLVEVSPMARPPVCKIMDYGKFKYQQKRKAAETKKNQKIIEVKEVKFRPKTGEHDFQVKVRHLREFILEGDKGKVTIMFRGREIVHPEIGQDVLRKVAEAISDIGSVESMPRMEGRQMFMIVAPGKASPRRAAPMPGQAPGPQGAGPQGPGPGGPGGPGGNHPQSPGVSRPMNAPAPQAAAPVPQGNGAGPTAEARPAVPEKPAGG